MGNVKHLNSIQERLATLWLADMPQAAVDIVQNKRLAAAVAIVKLESDITRPSCKDPVPKKYVGVKQVKTLVPNQLIHLYNMAHMVY